VPGASPALSFGIPYFRGLDYLGEAIDSVLGQTFDDWELVVVDDRGPEPAGELVAGYADPRITYVRNAENLGLAGNWNECVRRTRAPLVTLLHNDDRLMPTYAARVVEAARLHREVHAVFTDATIIGPDGQATTTLADRVKGVLPRRKDDHVLSGDADLAGLLTGNYIVCPTLCLRRSKVGDQPFDSSLAFVPDWHFTSGVLLGGGSLFSIREPLLEYRRHPAAETAKLTADSSRFAEEIAFLRDMHERAAARGFTRAARVARRRVTVRAHLLVRALFDAGARRWAPARDKWRLLRDDLDGVRVGVDHPDPEQ
jgi:glycosyltransferase involved in cell wall biosynthesis